MQDSEESGVKRCRRGGGGEGKSPGTRGRARNLGKVGKNTGIKMLIT